MSCGHCFAREAFRDDDRQNADILEAGFENASFADEELNLMDGQNAFGENVRHNETRFACRSLQR